MKLSTQFSSLRKRGIKKRPQTRTRSKLATGPEPLEYRCLLSVAPLVDLTGTGAPMSGDWSNAGPVNIATAEATIADETSADLTTMTAAIASPQNGDVLSADTSGTAISASFDGGTLTLSGSDTLASYQQVLRTIAYDNTAGGPGVASETVNVVATDDAALVSDAAAATISNPSIVASRLLFYNQSAYDNNTAGVDWLDDAAISNKVAYLPGGPASTNAATSFVHESNYTKGINGIMVDLTAGGTHSAITSSDFHFVIGVDDGAGNLTFSGATAGQLPTTVSTRAGAGAAGSDRVELLWANNALRHVWLEVQVKADANTGLAQNPNYPAGIGDIFYFASMGGDTADNSGGSYITNSTDLNRIRSNAGNGVPVDNTFDVNKDSIVNSLDMNAARSNAGNMAWFSVAVTGPFEGTIPAVPKVHLRTDSNNDGTIDASDDAAKAQTPGRVITLDAQGQGPLAPIEILADPGFASALTLSYTPSILAIYANSDGTGPISNGGSVSPNTVVYAKGIAAGATYVSITSTSSNGDYVLLTVIGLDLNLRIDSNNDGVLDSSDDAVATTPGLPGKIMVAENADSNGNGIPDYADGYNLPSSVTSQFAGAGIDPTATNDAVPIVFTPLVLTIANSVDLSAVDVRFIYNSSDPAALTFDGTDFQAAAGDLRIWTKDGSQLRNSAPVNAATSAGDFLPAALSDSDTSADITPAELGITSANRTVTLYVEGIAESANLASDPIRVVLAQANTTKAKAVNTTVSKPELHFSKIKDVAADAAFNETNGDLIKRTNTNVLAADAKKAWVPLNDDDDDNNGVPDNVDPTVSSVENDLLPFSLVAPSNTAGTFRLVVAPSGTPNILIWQKVGAVYNPVSSTTKFNVAAAATVPNLYIEAIKVGASGVATATINVKWQPNNAGPEQSALTDTINIFKIAGARNVPDQATYSYLATGGQGGSQGNTPNSVFIAPEGGTEKANVQSNSPTTGDAQSVLWTDGATFGKLRYQASPNFTWAFDVAIVEVDLDFNTGGATAITTANQTTSKPIQSTVVDVTRHGRIDSTPGPSQGVNTPAMTAQATITETQGPTRVVDGQVKMYGVSHIQVGFIQTLTFTSFDATRGAEVLPIGNLDGQTLVDIINKKPADDWTYQNLNWAAATTSQPWYDPGGLTVAGSKGVFQSQQDTTVLNQVLKIADTPMNNGLSSPIFFGGLPIDGYMMKWTFTDYVAVQTTDTGNNADTVFTPRAKGTWTFDGTGKFQNPSNTNVSFGTYKFDDGTGVLTGTNLSDVSDGTPLPTSITDKNANYVNKVLNP